MALYFTRRSYNAQKKTFTHNVASLTRYVELGADNRGRSLKREDWLPLVQAEMQVAEVTIYIHGFNTNQPTMLERRAKIEAGLRANGYRGAVIAYDWPSDGNVFTYDGDKNDAKKTAPCLVSDAILPLLSLSPKPRINLLAHSMGAYLTLRALSDFSDADGPGNRNWKLNEVAFISGDADSHWFGKGAWGSLLLEHRAKRFTNYFSQLDEVLNLPALLGNGLRLRVGRVGMPELIAKSHVDVYSHEQFEKDVPAADRSSIYTHSWWFDNAAFMKDLAATYAGTADANMPTRRRTDKGRSALLS